MSNKSNVKFKNINDKNYTHAATAKQSLIDD
jgi:hypothetical protein